MASEYQIPNTGGIEMIEIELIKPSIDVWGPPPLGREEMMQRIERAGRLCYKSEDKITAESATPFVVDKAKNRHMSVLEFGWIVFRTYCDISLYSKLLAILAHHHRVQFHKIVFYEYEGILFFGGSLRAWIDTFEITPWRTSFQPLIDIYCLLQEKYPEFFQLPSLRPAGGWAMITRKNMLPVNFLPICIKFTIDRGITHEMVRRRPCSFLQESTRYVNYLKRPARFILPPWFYDKIEPGVYGKWGMPGLGSIKNPAAMTWIRSILCAYEDYCLLMNENVVGAVNKQRPEQARGLLQNALAAELLVQADVTQWHYMFHLRSEENPGAHPQMREVMEMVRQDFISRGLYNDKRKN